MTLVEWPIRGVAGMIQEEALNANDVRTRRVIAGFDALRRVVHRRFAGLARVEVDRLRRQVVALHESGNDREAEAAAWLLVERQRVLLGSHHPDLATSLGNLALLLQKRLDHSAAEPLLREALEIRRATLGERHPHYATALGNLALLLCERGALQAAEPLLRQALEVRRAALGEQHPDYATGLAGLAVLHQLRGELGAAEPLLRQALEIRRAALGEEHPRYATALSNLGLLLGARGELDMAEPLLRQALEIRRAALGETHPDCASSRSHLTQLLQQRSGNPVASQSQALRSELERWIAASTTVGAALRRAAVLMETGGYPLGDRLLREAADCAAAFTRLRAEVVRIAECAGIFPASPEDLLSLPRLAVLLDAAIRAEAEHASTSVDESSTARIREEPVEHGVGDLGLSLPVDDHCGPAGADPGDAIAQREDRPDLGVNCQEPEIGRAEEA
jgi:tetratricopeptide (TPR) repeat protein